MGATSKHAANSKKDKNCEQKISQTYVFSMQGWIGFTYTVKFTSTTGLYEVKLKNKDAHYVNLQNYGHHSNRNCNSKDGILKPVKEKIIILLENHK